MKHLTVPNKRSPKTRPKKALGLRPRGRPPGDGFKPTAEQRNVVMMCAGYKMPEDEIARVVINPKTGKPISKVTLLAHFRADLDNGFATVKMRVMAASVRSAVGERERKGDGTEDETGKFVLPPNVTAQIWLSKALFGMRENVAIELPAAATLGPEGQDGITLENARRVAFALSLGASIAEKQPPKLKKA